MTDNSENKIKMTDNSENTSPPQQEQRQEQEQNEGQQQEKGLCFLCIPHSCARCFISPYFPFSFLAVEFK